MATARRFIMPDAVMDGSGQQTSPLDNHGGHVNSPFWYSFDYGSIHFVMLSTEHDATPGSRQYKVIAQRHVFDTGSVYFVMLLTVHDATLGSQGEQ